jgi:hypothetical protein
VRQGLGSARHPCCPSCCSPSRKPFLNLRGRSFRVLMRPVPVVRLRMAFWPHWSADGQAMGGRSRQVPGRRGARARGGIRQARMAPGPSCCRAGCWAPADARCAHHEHTPPGLRQAISDARAAAARGCPCDGGPRLPPAVAANRCLAPSSTASGQRLTGPLPGSGVAARGAGALLDVEAPLAAATAQRVRLVAALTCGGNAAGSAPTLPRSQLPAGPGGPARADSIDDAGWGAARRAVRDDEATGRCCRAAGAPGARREPAGPLGGRGAAEPRAGDPPKLPVPLPFLPMVAASVQGKRYSEGTRCGVRAG